MLLFYGVEIFLLAVAELFVIVTGGIDLSVGYVLGLASIVSVEVIRGLAAAGMHPLAALLVGAAFAVLVGLLPGLVNGWLVAYLDVPPFIATFSMLGACHGVSELISQGIYAMGLPQLAADVGSGHFLYWAPGAGLSLFSRPEVERGTPVVEIVPNNDADRGVRSGLRSRLRPGGGLALARTAAGLLPDASWWGTIRPAMRRFEQRPSASVQYAVVVSLAAVFWADLLTPLGIAVWVVYVLPVALTLYARRPGLPLMVAGVATALTMFSYFHDPAAGFAPQWLAVVNRTFGIVVLWVLAATARQSVVTGLALRERDWVRAGAQGLAAAIGGEQTPAQLGGNALRFFAEYAGASLGAFYAAEVGRLRLVATQAVDPQSPPSALVSPGEGLVGQAAAGARPEVVEPGPEDGLRLRSSFGTVTPRLLAVQPARADGAVVGVVELGFPAPAGPEQALLAEVGELLGVGLRSAQIRGERQALLEETQRQAEELEQQQRQLEGSNQELEEQTATLRESEARLEAQQLELEQTNARLEGQAGELARQRDELAHARDELRSKGAEVARVSQYKSEFLANMSHELRTPLNSSLILANLLAENRTGNLTPEQVEYARTIHGAGEDLLALVNDVLDLSKIEAGQLELRPEPVPLQPLLDGLRRAFEPIAAGKGLALEARLEPGAPERLETDPRRLEQILRNLLSNALKFTARGEVSLAVSARPAGQVAFAVRDTGIGIAAEAHEVIFEAFRQADGGTQRRYGGTGLGLAISRDLAERLGGALRVQSAPGEGSTFTLELPLRAGDRPAALPPPAEPAAPQAPIRHAPVVVPDDREGLAPGDRSVLVVEDDPRFAGVLRDLAHELGFRCLVATSAAEGVELARRHVPAGIVLDVRLPEESGLTVLERLKRDASTRHIPVHVVSVTDCARQAIELGAVGFAAKPVRREELVEAFRGLERRFSRSTRRVLLVDGAAAGDGPRGLLRDVDVEVVEVGTARDARERLGAAAFDCMVLDLGSPGGAGLALLEELAAGEEGPLPPVIAYAERPVSPDEEHRLQRCSRSMVIKDARSPERLLDEVTLFLHLVEARLPPAQQQRLREVRGHDDALEGRRILVAEDDVRNVFALASLLEARGARVVLARDGREALAALEAPGPDGRPPVDLVLMDVMMPGLDGLAATREIRRRPALEHLPVVALTAKAMPEDRERCLEAGADDYIPKPVDAERLLSLVRVWLRPR